MQPGPGTVNQGIAPALPFPPAAARQHIAVVEPHLTVRQLYELELQEEGYNTITLARHVELFSLLAGTRMDLVISGDEKQEREQSERTRLITLALQHNIPLIINTGYPFSWFNVSGIAGIAVVFKSANLEKLKNKIRRMLAHSDRNRSTERTVLSAGSGFAAI